MHNERKSGDYTYLFNLGDGQDTISDSSGSDTILFGTGLTASNLVTKVVEGSNDLVVAIREDLKSFEELSDNYNIKKLKNYTIKYNYNHFTRKTFTNTTKQDNIKTYLYIQNSLEFKNNKKEVA